MTPEMVYLRGELIPIRDFAIERGLFFNLITVWDIELKIQRLASELNNLATEAETIAETETGITDDDKYRLTFQARQMMQEISKLRLEREICVNPLPKGEGVFTPHF